MLTAHEKTRQTAGGKPVHFRFYAPGANAVSLVGNFNNWNEKKHPMTKTDDGFWRQTVLLEPNTYEYKFKVDGVWLNDPENPFACPNRFGTENNFFLVE